MSMTTHAFLRRQLNRKIALVCLIVCGIAPAGQAFAASRAFYMTVFGAAPPGHTDFSWFSARIAAGSPAGIEPQPPGLSILAIEHIYHDPQYASDATPGTLPNGTQSWQKIHDSLAGLGYDWSRIVAVNIDEPYVSHTPARPNGETNTDRPCFSSPDDRRTEIVATSNYIENAALAVQALASEKKPPGTAIPLDIKFWVNFHPSEVDWMRAGGACDKRLIAEYVDVISFDQYRESFESTLRARYEWIKGWATTGSHERTHQLALVPGLFSIDGKLTAVQTATYLTEYFEYADEVNSDCLTHRVAPKRGRDLGQCLVWLVAGWPGTDPVEYPVGGTGNCDGQDCGKTLAYDLNAPFAAVWRSQFRRRIDRDWLVPALDVLLPSN